MEVCTTCTSENGLQLVADDYVEEATGGGGWLPIKLETVPVSF